MGPRAVLRGLGLRNGDFYRFPLTTTAVEWDYASFIQSMDCSEEAEDGKQWKVTLQYGPFDWTSQGGATTEAASDGRFDPFAVPPKVHWGSNKFERFCIKDALGNPITNTVNDPFDPPLKRDDSRPLLTITRNEPSFDASLAQTFKDHVNAGPFLGYDPNTVKCHDITADKVYHADYGYYAEVTYEFEIREYQIDASGNILVNGWFETVLNAGLRQIDINGNPAQIMINNTPVTSPVMLTTGGRYVGAAGQPHYIDFQIYPSADFDKLNIDKDILNYKSVPGAGGS